MGLISNSTNKWAFIHIPKTGGTSLSSILNNIDGSELIAVHDSIRALNGVVDFFIFTIVRNPFTRIASAYLHRLRKGEYTKSFGEFIAELSEYHGDLIPQSYYINAGKTEDTQVSFIAKYEKHPNLKQQKFYKEFYTENWMIDNILERYQDDFKIFNYDMDLPR